MAHARTGRYGAFLGVLVGVAFWVAPGQAAVPPSAEAVSSIRRSLSLLSVVAEEYREGVVDGQLVRPIEYEEALVFLGEAEQRLQLALGEDPAPFTAPFAAVRHAIETKTDSAAVAAQLASLRDAVSAATDVTEEVFPPEPPSAGRGQALFAQNCVPCHGTAADGRGPNAEGLQPPPANFTDAPFMRQETPLDFFHIMSVGKTTSAMPAWGTVLSLQERWDLISYIWSVQSGHGRLAEGQGVYLAQCAGCHGPTADGHGPWSASLLTPAPPLNQPAALAQRTDTDLFAAVSDGVPGAPMPGFAHTLSERERWAAVAYLRALSLGGAVRPDAAVPASASEPRRFAGLLRLLGEEYAKAYRPGGEVDPLEYRESQILLELIQAQRDAVLTQLATVSSTDAATVRGALEQIAQTVAARGSADVVRTLAISTAGTIETHAPSGSGTAPSVDDLAEVRRMLDGAVAAYRDGNAQATYLVSDAYFQFEPFEAKLATTAPHLTRQIEARFLELRGVLAKPGNDARAAELVAAIGNDLDATRDALAPATGGSALFVQSATIILREGFEVVLIVGALLAYVVKVGQPQMRRPIVLGTVAGVAFSLLTAYGLVLLVRETPMVAEALEGLTLLLAAAVLFSVSYWLISKAEADKWQRYIQGKVQAALSRASGLALAGAAFLAVFREGVETVLFYRALMGTAGGQLGMVVAGFGVGLVALAILYALFARFGRRVPIRQFFLGTSVLLYYLAFVFAGRGVAELQQIGWVNVTPLPGVPQIDLLGIRPTLETCVVQGLLLVLLFYAVYVTVRKRSSSPDDPLLTEMRQLREATVGLRIELSRVVERDPQTSQQVGERLETLINRVTELEGQMAPERPNGGRKRPSGHAS